MKTVSRSFTLLFVTPSVVLANNETLEQPRDIAAPSMGLVEISAEETVVHDVNVENTNADPLAATTTTPAEESIN